MKTTITSLNHTQNCKKSPFPVALCIFKAEDAKYADSEEVEASPKVGSVDFYEKKKRKIDEVDTDETKIYN